MKLISIQFPKTVKKVFLERVPLSSFLNLNSSLRFPSIVVAVLKYHVTRMQREYRYFYLPHQRRREESA
jgi:hypothetical protein